MWAVSYTHIPAVCDWFSALVMHLSSMETVGDCLLNKEQMQLPVPWWCCSSSFSF